MNTKDIFSVSLTKDSKTASVTMKGIVPKNMIAQERGALADSEKGKGLEGVKLWEKSAYKVFSGAFPEIVAEEKLAPLGPPELQFTKLADGEDAHFQLTFAVVPEINLPPYKELLKGVKKPGAPKEVTDKEVDAMLLNLRRGLYKEENPDKEIPEDAKELPELTDDVIKKVSQKYTDLESFKAGVRESLAREHQMRAKMQNRQQIIEAILSAVEFGVPEVIVEEDVKQTQLEFEARMKTLNKTVEDFLKQEKLSKEDLEKQFKEEAIKRAKTQFVIAHISKKENINADEGTVQKELERFKSRTKTKMSDEASLTYIRALIVNEMVMRFLEGKVE